MKVMVMVKVSIGVKVSVGTKTGSRWGLGLGLAGLRLLGLGGHQRVVWREHEGVGQGEGWG